MIKYIVKKSMDLTNSEKSQLCGIFEIVFGQKRTLEELENLFISNCKGYIYIALMVAENEKIVGTMSVMPLEYKYFGKNMIFGRGIDAMILEGYRGNLLNLKKMSDLLEEILKEDEIPFIFSAPNEQNYLVRKRISKWKDIYNLDIYALPINIGSIKSSLMFLNLFSKVFAKTINMLISKRCTNTDLHFGIEKIVDTDFKNKRYDNSYKEVLCANGSYFIYKIQNFQGIETAFIVDISFLNKTNLQFAVKQIVQTEKNIDLVVYFGYLNFKPLNLYRIPDRIKPKNTNLAGKILLPSIIDDRIFNIENWNFNLSDLDWI